MMAESQRDAYAVHRCIWDARAGILRLVVRNVLNDDSVDIVRYEIYTHEEMLAATELLRSCNITVEVTGAPMGAHPISPMRH